MSIFVRKITVTTKAPAQELKIQINGTTFKDEDVRMLMAKFNIRDPQELQDYLSKILKLLDITVPLKISGKNLMTENGEIISYTDSSHLVSGPRYPFVTIINGNIASAYTIMKNSLVPKHLEIIQDGKEVTFYYTYMDNDTRPAITIKQENYLLNINFAEEKVAFKVTDELQQELLALNLTKKPTPAEVYKIIHKYFDYPVTIELGILNNIFVYMFWRISVSGGECYYLFEAELSANNDGYESITTVNNKENSFRYEEPHTLEYSFKKGRFRFETNSEAFEDDFLSCKKKIADFKEKMKHILS